MSERKQDRYDVLVLGGGAAGLAAAAALGRAGRRVCVLEARERLGGRIYSHVEADSPAPLELGAEFVHGRAAATLGWLRRGGSTFVDAAQTRWTRNQGELEPSDDLFEEMRRGLAKAPRPRADLPFAEFLDGAARKALSARARQFARMLVEGFDAADAARVSTFGIIDEWSGQGAADAPTFRPLHGYGALVRTLASALDPQCVRVQLNAVVHEVRWRRGEVQMEGRCFERAFSVTASCAIVTLPLGVLQRPPRADGAVRFAPSLARKAHALAGLGVGPVLKLLLKFELPFWEELDDGRYRDAAFFHAPGAPFPTFWSSLPLRTTVLNAWAAGPNAARLAGLGEGEIVQAALDSLEKLFGRRAGVRRRLCAARMHDWQADPFARGAYSYVVAGAQNARRELARPLAATLFFAGEATDVAGEPATVAGALQSGERAAAEVLRI